MMEEPLEFQSVSVGKKFPLFPESVERLKGQDGAFFEAEEFGQGYLFCIHLTNIEFMEKNSFRNDKISVRIFRGDSGMILPIIQFGKSMMFEMVFDPTIYPDNRAFQLAETNNILSLFLVESTTGELKAIRQCNLPLKMIQICKEAWGRAILDINFSKKFSDWTETIKGRSLEDLWGRAIKVGTMGETYDLQDINMPIQHKNNIKGEILNEEN